MLTFSHKKKDGSVTISQHGFVTERRERLRVRMLTETGRTDRRGGPSDKKR